MKRKGSLMMAFLFLLVCTVAIFLPLQAASAHQSYGSNNGVLSPPNVHDRDGYQRDDVNWRQQRWDSNDWDHQNLMVTNPNGNCIQNFIKYPDQFILESRFAWNNGLLHWGSPGVISKSNVSNRTIERIASKYDISEYCAIYQRYVNEQKYVRRGHWITVSKAEYRFEYQIIVYNKYNDTYQFNRYDYGKWLSESEYNNIMNSQLRHSEHQNRPPDPSYMRDFKNFIL